MLFKSDVHILRIGDKLSDQLKIPKEYKGKIKDVKKYCTKLELEMLLLISEGLDADFEKEKSKKSHKIFSKEHVIYNKTRYDNSTVFYRNYYGDRIDLLVDSIKRYKQLKGKHQRDEGYLADLLK